MSSYGTSGCLQQPLMAIQVTIFPNVGISIGVAFCHVAADGKTLAHFMKSWASVHSSQGDLTCLNNSVPNFNWDLIKDPLGLASLFMKNKCEYGDLSSIPIHKFRITSDIKRSQVDLLKDWVKRKCMEENGSEPTRMSTFVVTCAYMWACLIKLQESGTQHLLLGDSNELSHFLFAADCRDRLKLPTTYFGNCIVLRFATAKKSELTGQNGILVAARAIGKEVMELDKGPLKGAEASSSKRKEIFKTGHHVIIATASPKLGVFNVDFGWGRPRKTELATIGLLGSLSMFSIAENRDEEGGVEFGLALAPDELDSFNAVFNGGLLKLL
ncbi:hypothetical protein CRYUN_Cryun26dG0087100 [Craigia yunnanensis]